MAAPQGNQFWKLRSKHGRDKIFSSPHDLWDAACEYFEWCENNPLIEVDFKGKDAVQVEIPKMRAFTMHGLCLYLDCNTHYFHDFKASIKETLNNKESSPGVGLAKDFSYIITRIEEIVYNQKFTGAAAGFLHPNIIARDLGLRDATDNNVKISKIPKIEYDDPTEAAQEDE